MLSIYLKKYKEQIAIIILFVLFVFITAQGHPKILGKWEGSVIYNIFNPSKLPNLFPIIQKGADSVGNHGFAYNLLALTRIIADHSEHSITAIKILPIVYGFITLCLLYIIVRRWFGWLTAVMCVLILMTNQYFLIMSKELVSSSTLSTMLILFVIERYQKLETKSNRWTILSFAFICALAATNYIVVRLVMLSIIFIYMIDIETINKNGLSINHITNKERIKTTGYVLISIVIFLFLFFPLNIIYLFDSNFIFPMTGEYATNAQNIFSSIYYNSLYIWNYFILGNGSIKYSTDLFVDIPYPFEGLFVFVIALIGIVYGIIKIKDKKYIFMLSMVGLLIGLCLISDLKPDYETLNLEVATSLNHYRVFSLIIFIAIFAAIGINKLLQYSRQYDNRATYLIYSFIVIISIIRINAYVNEIQRFNNHIENFPFDFSAPAISKHNPIDKNGFSNDALLFDDRRHFHDNQIYFYKLAQYITKQINASGEKRGLIFIDPEMYTPDYYRIGGGDIPWKGHPYYFQMYLSFYLQDGGLNTSYLLKKEDVSLSILKQIINIVDRYNRGETPPNLYPRNEKEERNVILANKIFNFVKSFSYGKKLMDSYMQKDHYYSNIPKYDNYFLNVTNRLAPDYIIVTNQKEMDALQDYPDNKTLLELGSFSVNL